MRRIFWNPVAALVAAVCFRLFFFLKFPANSGDAVVYEQIAANWLQHHVFAMNIGDAIVPVDLRVPGYPAFLAIVYAISRHTGEAARLYVRIAQAMVDVGTCFVIASLAALLARLARPGVATRNVYMAALWLAALCPFTAHYVAVPLTETWATFFTGAGFALLSLVIVRFYRFREESTGDSSTASWDYRLLAALGGFVVGLGTLFRPETPLLLMAAYAVLAYFLLRTRELRRFILVCILLFCGFALPLLPWVVRNAITLHEFQPLAPKNTMLPGELDPKGFMAWERTWLYRFRDCYLVSWKLNDEEIHLEDIPGYAFDSPEEREQVAGVLEKYNDEITWTADEDAVFAQIARERTARHPLRTYLWVPLRRAERIWFTPRIELLPVAGNVFPLAYQHEEDPVDQRVTIGYFFLNIVYVALGILGAWKLWRYPAVRPAVGFILLYILARTAFLATLETPEPRYVLVCFPAVLALAAQLFQRNAPPAN